MFLLCTNSVLLNKALIVQFGSYCLCAGNKTKGQHGLIAKSDDLSEVKKVIQKEEVWVELICIMTELQPLLSV